MADGHSAPQTPAGRRRHTAATVSNVITWCHCFLCKDSHSIRPPKKLQTSLVSPLMLVLVFPQHLEENPKASAGDIQQVLKEFTDSVIGSNADTSDTVKPVSA